RGRRRVTQSQGRFSAGALQWHRPRVLGAEEQRRGTRQCAVHRVGRALPQRGVRSVEILAPLLTAKFAFRLAARGARTSGLGHQQRLDISASGKLRVRGLEALSQLPLANQNLRPLVGVVQIVGLPERDVEESIAEVSPFGAVLAAEGGVV